MADFKVTKCIAREVLDSRGNPTVEVELHTADGFSTAIVPSGASTGTYEALELRDGGSRYLGKGVQKAVANVGDIARGIRGFDIREQEKLDNYMIKLDGTPNKTKLGANAILGVSMAAARLSSNLSGMELYEYLARLAGTKPKMVAPFANIVNGGQHASGDLKIQEFMIVPRMPKFADSMRAVSEVYHTLKGLLKERYGKNSVNVGDEGGFAPPFKTGDEALKTIRDAIEKAGYKGKVEPALDAAASAFFSNGIYGLEQPFNSKQLVDYWKRLVADYGVVSLEDPFAEDDFEGWALLTKALGSKIPIIGDDLLVTNVNRIKIAVEKKLCNSLLLKVNQIGSLTEAIQAAKLAISNSWGVMVSHRSGETEDTFIADLSVALGCGQIKIGAPCRSERTAKYNRLLRISEKL